VIVRGGTVTVSAKDTVAFVPRASVTVAATVATVTAVGVPDMAPDGLPDKPAGKPLSDQVYGMTPPVALKPAEYATPTAPAGRLVVVMVSAAGETVRAKLPAVEVWLESVTVTESV
jgi:hypothetical protein